MQKFLFFLTFTLIISAWNNDPEYIIKGKVTDESGEALIGASVLIKGTTNGTLTDLYGKFQLKSNKKTVDLVISYTGFTTQKIKAEAGKELNISMEDGAVLEEVVVVGAGKRPKRAKKKKREKLQEAPASINIRGSRANATEYYLDGIRVQGNLLSNKKIPRDKSEGHYSEESYDIIKENRFLDASGNPLSTFSIDVDAASYSNMRRYILNKQMPPKDAVRIEELVNYFEYDYPEPEGEDPFAVITEVSECPWASEHQLVHIGLQGKKIPTKHLPASNLVFLVDVSGSMSSPNKLPLLKSSFELLIDQLRPQDRVAMVVYAGAAGLVLPSTSGKDKETILAALDQLKAGGSTAGGAGIQLAYNVARKNFVQGGNNRVILATDGDFNVGASGDDDMVRLIEKERKSGVFLTVLGFGMGNYKDSKMQKLADKGNGNHAYIDNIKEAKKVLVNEFGGTMFTIAKDVKIQIEFNPAKIQGYRLIGYENRLLNKEDFDDDTKDAGELGAGHTVTALYEVIPIGVETDLLTQEELKYQEKNTVSTTANGDDLFTVKLRYKKPDGGKSKLIEQPVKEQFMTLEQSSENFRWSAAVASFGMLLRDSEFKGNGTYTKALDLAKSGKGKDKKGYRKELIEMIELADSFGKTEVVSKGNK